jgi:hypothetical protein
MGLNDMGLLLKKFWKILTFLEFFRNIILMIGLIFIVLIWLVVIFFMWIYDMIFGNWTGNTS